MFGVGSRVGHIGRKWHSLPGNYKPVYFTQSQYQWSKLNLTRMSAGHALVVNKREFGNLSSVTRSISPMIGLNNNNCYYNYPSYTSIRYFAGDGKGGDGDKVTSEYLDDAEGALPVTTKGTRKKKKRKARETSEHLDGAKDALPETSGGKGTAKKKEEK